MLGANHPDTLTNMNNLASTLWSQGRWKEAEELEVQVMETRKNMLGTEHPATLISMKILPSRGKNMAEIYRILGRWRNV